MSSMKYFATGVGAVGVSVLIPGLGLVLIPVALGCFVAGERAARWEDKYIRPVKEARHEVWIKTLTHAYNVLLGAEQAKAEAEIDWTTAHQRQLQDLPEAAKARYIKLFAGLERPDMPQQTVDVRAEQVQPVEQMGATPPQSQQQQHFSAPHSTEDEAEMMQLFAGAMPLPDDPAPIGVQEADTRTAMPPFEDDPTPVLNLNTLMRVSLLIIWGTPGGRKTTLARCIGAMREAYDGHIVTVADPHGSPHRWGEWNLIGSGRNFKAIDGFLQLYDQAVTNDYKKYAEGFEDFPYSTTIVDEFTQWSDECSNSGKFVKTCCTDIRKLHRCVILVTHSDTLAGLGNAEGMRAAIDRAAVKLQLETTISPENGEYQATGYAWIQYPGQKRQRVRIPWE